MNAPVLDAELQPVDAGIDAREMARRVAAVMQKADHLFLEPVTWEEYQAILDELEPQRRLRHTYDRGRLELMTRSFQHERPKMLWAYVVLVLAEEWGRKFEPGGEVTLSREDVERGLEPDQCFWVENAARVRGKKRPAPDLFVEIEVCRTLLDRLKLLAALRVPEVWRVSDEHASVGILQSDGNYLWGSTSQVFPGLNVTEMAQILRQQEHADLMDALQSLRAWLRNQRNQ